MTARQKELYELAKKEGEVTWYTAHSNDTTAQALGRDFEAAFPGIKANVVRTTAQVAYQRVSQEIKAGAMQVDVLSSTDIGHYVSLKEKNLLEQYVPENASKVIDVYKNYDPDGYYTVTSAGLIGIGYNTAKLKEADAPKNWPDLLDPKWKDKIALGHPGFSGYVGTWVVSLKKLYGWDFFEKLAKNNPQVGRSINDTVTMLNAGERIVAGSGPNGTAMESAGKGNPLAMTYPPDGSVLIIAPSGNHERREASERREAVHGISARRRGLEDLGEALQQVDAARGVGARRREIRQGREDDPPDGGGDHQGHSGSHQAVARHVRRVMRLAARSFRAAAREAGCDPRLR